jgi:hypothetical protein
MSISSQDINVEGRIVMGHPIKRQKVTRKDEKTKQDVPVMLEDGMTQATQVYFSLAVPKGQETDWKQTPWGQTIHSIGLTAYKDMTSRHDFSWKVEDGDSNVPNKNNRKNCDTEGHQAHWIIKCSTRLDVPVYPVGKYSPFDIIRGENDVHTGDYYMVSISVADNTDKNGQPAQSPGVYMNPRGVVYLRKGDQIIGENQFDAASVFGGMNLQGQQPQASTPPPVTQQAPITPAHDLVQPGANVTPPPALPPAPAEPSYNVSGTVHTKSQLVTAGYTDAHFATMTPVA